MIETFSSEIIMSKPLVVAITGASGVIYGVTLLKALKEIGQETHLIITDSAKYNIAVETGSSLDEICDLATVVHKNSDFAATIASGSFLTRGMIVAPCSIKTLSGIANSFTSNLTIRAADVSLKEKRPLVLMVRETPLHKGHLDLMSKVADMGATILPPMPSFYHEPESIQDIINQSIGKALDQVSIEHDLFKRWPGGKAAMEARKGKQS
jgi:4-hydroxy-3-polyprenylbenzoate decarboxylase